MSPVARLEQEPLAPRSCINCDATIPVGATYYRAMIAEHKNDRRWFSSRRRVLDRTMCQGCYDAVTSVLHLRRSAAARRSA
jgi:hypothetical protein